MNGERIYCRNRGTSDGRTGRPTRFSLVRRLTASVKQIKSGRCFITFIRCSRCTRYLSYKWDFHTCKLYRSLHRDSDKRLQNKSKSGHEERVLATQKCLVGGGNGRAFDARYLLDFQNHLFEQEKRSKSKNISNRVSPGKKPIGGRWNRSSSPEIFPLRP